MGDIIRIGIIGDFDPEFRSHVATNAAISHAAAALSIDAEVRWLPTNNLGGPSDRTALGEFDGLWAAPGSPYKNIDGALAAIRFAREQDRPFIGT